jgi:mycothiol synthase
MRASSGFDPVADTVVAEVDGICIGYDATSWRLRDGVRTYGNEGGVLPTFRRRGLGRALFRHGEGRARTIAAGHTDDAPKSLMGWASENEAGLVALLDREGYRRVRWFFEMVRDTLDDLPEAPLPPGVELRPVRVEHMARIMSADNEAFRDHWGHAEATAEDDARFLANPDLRRDLWSVGWAGEEVAGSVLVSVPAEENERFGRRRGWLDHVSVRRPWRGKGLATALMVASLCAMREDGLTSAGLGVDADNPTGAVGLYERLGFRVGDRASAWSKDLVAGKDAASSA